ncbi:hypothetical protein ACWF7H_24305 [Peribacillus butanolivorans]|uniref:hypothetical protein n=1 Tax=Peribacillus butanolivorans TaxID=421767 RepID=UPI0036765021
MTVRELYHETVKNKHTSHRMLIEFLVYEKNTVNFTDDQSQNQMKRNFVLGKLIALEVTHSHHGRSIEFLDYDDLKYELVLSAYKKSMQPVTLISGFRRKRKCQKLLI